MNLEMGLLRSWGNTSDSSYFIDVNSPIFDFADLTNIIDGGYGDNINGVNAVFDCSMDFHTCPSSSAKI